MYWVIFALSFVLATFWVNDAHESQDSWTIIGIQVVIRALVIFYFSTSLIAWGVS